MTKKHFQRLPSALSDWLNDEGFDPTRPDEPGRHGNTPLMHAAWRGADTVVQTLLDLGANPYQVSQEGFSALDMAASTECLLLLRAAMRRQTDLSTMTQEDAHDAHHFL